jgi:hypothetical protein
MSSLYVKVNHVLPEEVVQSFASLAGNVPARNAYVRALRAQGWSLQSIGDIFSVSRERIRQICSEEPSLSNSGSISGLPLPTPPLKPVREKKVYPEPSAESLERLKELQPLAQQVRSHSPRFRKEAEEYSALIFKVYKEEGVSLFRLARHLGVTHGSLRFRLSRYGYVNSSKSNSTCYRPILEKNRYTLQS